MYWGAVDKFKKIVEDLIDPDNLNRIPVDINDVLDFSQQDEVYCRDDRYFCNRYLQDNEMYMMA